MLVPAIRSSFFAAWSGLCGSRRDPRASSAGQAKQVWLVRLPDAVDAPASFRVSATTASEARALAKCALGLTRLPVGTSVERYQADEA
jgi:hypothetical protein